MTAQPQDYLAPAAKTFTFEHDGQSFTIPHFKSLPIGAIRKARKAGNDTDATFLLLENVLKEDSAELAAIDSMDGEQFGKFLEGWIGKAPLGESSDS